jgi:hypothetical protein
LRSCRPREGSDGGENSHFQKGLDLLFGHGPAEEKALHAIDIDVAEELAMLFRFDPLGNDLEVETFRERDDGADERPVGGVEITPANHLEKDVVDLKGLQVEALEVCEGGITCAEIVDGDGNASRMFFMRMLSVISNSSQGSGQPAISRADSTVSTKSAWAN